MNANRKRPVIVYYEILQYRASNQELLSKYFDVIRLPDPSCDSEQALENADVILAPLGFYFGKDKIDRCRRLKIIASNTTGHPHIDVEYARRMNINVITLKTYHEFLETITPTAELAWGLIISLTRNIFPAFRSVLDGRWERWPFGGKKMLSRMSLGVAGYGRLGKKVASYGVCFGMIVRYFDPQGYEAPAGVESVDTLGQLVSESDIVTVHIPHEPETEKMFDEELFATFKFGSFFVNTSRGELVDHSALLAALDSGQIAGAALDVIDNEFIPGFQDRVLEHPVVRYAATHPNLIITPHIGGSTIDAWELTQEFTIRKTIEALENIA